MIVSPRDRRHLVVIRDRIRGDHDYEATIPFAFYTDSCSNVIFGFANTVWLADVSTGAVAELARGDSAFVLPPP